jgi:hypothetical protein
MSFRPYLSTTPSHLLEPIINAPHIIYHYVRDVCVAQLGLDVAIQEKTNALVNCTQEKKKNISACK